MNYTSLTVHVEDGLAQLVLTQPESGNAMGRVFCTEFCAAVHELAGRDDVRCILLSAKGKHFSVGGDLKGLSADLQALPNTVRDMTAPMNSALARLLRMDAPLVVCVQGTAAGGAVALLANCDLVFSARSARFGAAFSKIGFSCDSGAAFGLASRIGLSRARRFLILGEWLDAAQAEQVGLVDFVADDALVYGQAMAAATELCQGPTRAYGEIRRLCGRSLAQPFEQQLEDESQSMARLAASPDTREGLLALVEKRLPRFQGR